MPSIFRIFENGRYETSVKKQTVTAAFAPAAAAVVCSSPLSLHKEEESKATETRETRETRDFVGEAGLRKKQAASTVRGSGASSNEVLNFIAIRILFVFGFPFLFACVCVCVCVCLSLSLSLSLSVSLSLFVSFSLMWFSCSSLFCSSS